MHSIRTIDHKNIHKILTKSVKNQLQFSWEKNNCDEKDQQWKILGINICSDQTPP